MLLLPIRCCGWSTGEETWLPTFISLDQAAASILHSSHGSAERGDCGIHSKCRHLSAQTARQAKVYQFDYLKHNYEKKLEESCSLFSLLRLEISNLSNDLNTISKVYYRSAAVSLVFLWEISPIPQFPHKSVFFELLHFVL